jgi:hypothetical protein
LPSSVLTGSPSSTNPLAGPAAPLGSTASPLGSTVLTGSPSSTNPLAGLAAPLGSTASPLGSTSFPGAAFPPVAVLVTGSV